MAGGSAYCARPQNLYKQRRDEEPKRKLRNTQPLYALGPMAAANLEVIWYCPLCGSPVGRDDPITRANPGRAANMLGNLDNITWSTAEVRFHEGHFRGQIEDQFFRPIADPDAPESVPSSPAG